MKTAQLQKKGERVGGLSFGYNFKTGIGLTEDLPATRPERQGESQLRWDWLFHTEQSKKCTRDRKIHRIIYFQNHSEERGERLEGDIPKLVHPKIWKLQWKEMVLVPDLPKLEKREVIYFQYLED